MIQTPVLAKEPKSRIEMDDIISSSNGNGLLHDIHTYFRIIKRFRWLFLVFFTLIAALSFWYFNYTASFTSVAKFTITDWSQPNSFPNNGSIYSQDRLYTQDRVNQMLMLFLSDSIVQFLIQKYDLDGALKNPGSKIEREKLESDIASSISLEQSVFNSFSLRVTNSDRVLAANMANDIINKVTEISRNMYTLELAGRIDMLKSMLSTVNSLDSSSDDLLSSHFSLIQQQLNELAAKHLSLDQIRPIMSELGVLRKQYDDEVVQLKLNELMLRQVSSSGTRSITLIQKAIPDYSNYAFKWLFYSIAVALFLSTLFPLAIYIGLSVKEKKWL